MTPAPAPAPLEDPGQDALERLAERIRELHGLDHDRALAIAKAVRERQRRPR